MQRLFWHTVHFLVHFIQKLFHKNDGCHLSKRKRKTGDGRGRQRWQYEIVDLSILFVWLKRNLRNKNKAKKDDHKSWAIFRENCSGERSKYEHLFRAFIGIKLRNDWQISEKITSYNIVWVIILTEYNIDYNSVYLEYEYEYDMYSYFNIYIM